MSFQRCVAISGLALVYLLAGGSRALAQLSFIEDFTSETYKDVVNTTADWNTIDGELRLYPFVPGVVGSVATTNTAWDITLLGDLGFVADGSAGLRILDVTDPTSPTIIATLDTFTARDVCVAGDVAYVADGNSGVQVVDISDPTAPVLIATHDTPSFAWEVEVAGDHAYVADLTAVQIIDISNPAAPVFAGTYNTTGVARGICVAGDNAFVADDSGGLYVLGIEDPTSPTLTARYTGAARVRDVHVVGDVAYLALYNDGFQIVDVTDLAAPTLLGGVDTSGLAERVTVEGDVAYLTDTVDALVVIDVSDPTSPVQTTTVTIAGDARNVTIWGHHAFVPNDSPGVDIVRVRAEIPAPVEIASIGAYDAVAEVAVEGDLAYVAAWGFGLRVLDISDPASPVEVGFYDTADFSEGVAVAGNHAYLAGNTPSLLILDIADPTNPALAGSIDLPGIAEHVKIAGDHAYVTADFDGLVVIDVSDPGNPIQVGLLPLSFNLEDVTVSGDLAFVACGAGGVRIADISDPTSPVEIGVYDELGLDLSVAVAGDHAYVSNSPDGLRILDISDPSSPVELGVIDTGEALRAAIAGDRAYVAAAATGLRVIDISDPTSPTQIGFADTPDDAIDCAFAGNHVLVSSGIGGLQVMQFSRNDLDTTGNRGQSLAVDGADEMIVRARMTTVQVGAISWELSANGGAAWLAVTPGGWTSLMPGDELLWRSTHSIATGDPTVSELSLEWLTEAGGITGIVDVPDDQGGWVRIGFLPSGYDHANELAFPVTGYQIYQRVDDATAQRVIEEGNRMEAGTPGATLPGLDLSRRRQLGDRRFVLGSGDAGAGETFPPGTWEAVAWVAATQSDDYTARVSTTRDSTSADPGWSVYLTTTHTTTPSVWFVSAADSGYSIDNIAPGVPQNLVLGGPDVLQWDQAPEEDFAHHAVYGSGSPIFDGAATLIGYTVDPIFDVSGDPFGYFHVTTSDDADNESDAASIANPSVSAPDVAALPDAFALLAPRPNPFRAGTEVGFDLPAADRVKLTIFDASGRRIRQVTDGMRTVGRHRVQWDGRNEIGRRVAPGVYFARVEAGTSTESRRLVMIR